jgi:hypothetical protein
MLTGTSGLERAKDQQLQNAIALLDRQRKFAQSQSGKKIAEASEKEAAKVANEQLRNSQEAAVSMRDAARAIATASNEDKEGGLIAEADRLRAEIESLNRALSTGVAQWTNENRSALQSLVSDYQRTSVEIIKLREQDAKKTADAEAKIKEEAAKEWADLEKDVAKQVADERMKAMRTEGARLTAAATKQATDIQNRAKAAGDRALFLNRPQTFNERLQGFIERREAARESEKENRKALEREGRLREKQARGIGLSNRDAKFLKDIEAFRAAEKEAARQAAIAEKAEKHLEVIKDKIEKTLQAAGN